MYTTINNGGWCVYRRGTFGGAWAFTFDRATGRMSCYRCPGMIWELDVAADRRSGKERRSPMRIGSKWIRQDRRRFTKGG